MATTHIKIGRLEIVVILFILFLLALFSGFPIYWTAFWFFFLWLLFSFAWLIYTAHKLQLAFEITPRKTERNSYIEMTVSLFKKSLLPLPAAELYFTDRKDFLNRDYRIYFNNSVVKDKIDLESGGFSRKWNKKIQIECLNIGRKKIGPVKIKLSSPLGSIVVEKIFNTSGEFVVNPRILPFTSKFSPRAPEGKQKRQKGSFTPDYTESYDLRLFVRGDPPKLINWKVSAKQGDLYIKRAESNGGTELLICFELSKDFFSTDLEKDLFMEKTLSLIRHLLMKGYRVGVFCNEEKCYLPPESGTKRFFQIRRLFTELNGVKDNNLFNYLLNSPCLTENRGLILVVPYLNENYLMNIKDMVKGGRKFFLFTAGNHPYNGSNLPAGITPLHLKCENDRVSIRQVKSL